MTEDVTDESLDEGVVLCLDPGARRTELVEWLARHPRTASELAGHLADFRRIEHFVAPLRQVVQELPTVGEPATIAGDEPTSLEFGDFEILGELGRGAMGVVYKARQKSLDRVVGLKTTLAGNFPSARDVARLRFDGETAARLDHPNIVPIYGAGEHQGTPFFSMKFVPGGTLADKRDEFRRDQRAAAGLLAKVARAVHYAHQHGVLHRDLKPGNILMDGNGEPMVADFGLATAVDAPCGPNRSGVVVGTAPYMAPEQARGEKGLTTAADVYSLGAVLYELLTGRPPFRGDTVYDTIRQVIEQSPPEPRKLNADVHPDLEAVCLACLEKPRESRYASAADLADDLERFAAGMSVSVRPGGVVSQVVRAIRSRRQHGPAGDRWVAVVAYSSAVAAAAHLTIFGLLAADSVIGWVWLVLIANFAFLGAQRFRQSQRARSFVPWERHTIALWGGHVIAAVGLTAAMLPFDPTAPADRVLAWYPPFVVLYALALFVQGSTSWGGYFVASVVYIGLAMAMRFVGPAAPLLFVAVHVPATMFLSVAGLRSARTRCA